MNLQSKRYSRYYSYIQPVLKTPFIKTYGSTIFNIAAVTIFILFAIKPTVETIVLLQKKFINYQQTLSKISKKSEDLSAAKRNYQNLDGSIRDYIQGAIPTKPDLRTFMQTVEGAAAQKGASVSAVSVKSVTAQEAPPDKDSWQLTEIEFTINAGGAYESIKSFIKTLEESARIISIDSINARKNEDGTILMSISGKTYFLK